MELLKKNWHYIAIIIVFAWCIYTVSTINLQSLSMFTVAYLAFGIFTGGYLLIDKFLLRGYDTLEELAKGNIAVGESLIALAIVFHAILSFVKN